MTFSASLVAFTFLLAATGLLAANVPTAASLAAIPHPRLLITDAELPAIQARLAQDPRLQARYDNLITSARGWLKKDISLPPRGGQWFHWYVCKDDGANLITVSPTQHKCPTCGKVYSGWPYDDVLLSGVHSRYVNGARDLALAYRFTRDDRYAAKATEILLAYAAAYPTYPLHDKDGGTKVGGGKIGSKPSMNRSGSFPSVRRPICYGITSAPSSNNRSPMASCALPSPSSASTR